MCMKRRTLKDVLDSMTYFLDELKVGQPIYVTHCWKGPVVKCRVVALFKNMAIVEDAIHNRYLLTYENMYYLWGFSANFVDEFHNLINPSKTAKAIHSNLEELAIRRECLLF